ncbi:hypothetical protein IIM_04972 [Bacillus cereus VD107]|nr:hypothetical protein IIM_04972 [Bacillus cereus VD107]
MKRFFKHLAVVLSFSMMLTVISPDYSAFANVENDDLNSERLLTEDEFLHDIGFEDVTIDEFAGDNMLDYVDDSVETPQYYVAPIVVWIIVGGIKVSRIVYKAIKYAPKYPAGFKAVQNGTKNVNVNNTKLLSELRQIESGTWKKVYKDGYDKNGKKISIHYFQSKSGKVFDVKVKSGWSVK